MAYRYSDLTAFLEKMKPSGVKGWILYVPLNRLRQVLEAQQVQELIQMLLVFESEKLCRLFYENEDAFIYFGQTREDDIQALVLKMNFRCGFEPMSQEAGFQIFNLERQEDFVLGLLDKQKKAHIPTLASPLTPIFRQANQSMPFTPTLLAQLEKALLHADLSNIIRHQPVCAIVGKSPPMELFEEVYVAISDLKKAVCPNVDVFQAPWLFNRLMETLDKRVLENVIHHDGGAFTKNFSLNLTVKTILGPDFQKFDDSIDPSHKQTIRFELKQSDVLADIPAYLTACQMVHDKGYRVCLDMVTFESLPFIQREKLGLDMIKIIWSSSALQTPVSDELRAAVKAVDPMRIILCHVDDKNAIEYAKELGISFFQGYYIQKLLYKTPKAVKANRI